MSVLVSKKDNKALTSLIVWLDPMLCRRVNTFFALLLRLNNKENSEKDLKTAYCQKKTILPLLLYQENVNVEKYSFLVHPKKKVTLL